MILTTSSPHETEHLGVLLGEALDHGMIICLSGTLGAGKTCFTRGLARGWGALESPTSPTFVLVNQYHRSQDTDHFFHVDCYRMNGMADAISAGIEDLFDPSGVVVIEWAERIAAILPADRLDIVIEMTGADGRELRFTPHGDQARLLLSAIDR